jgi:hypothetical protein
MHLATRVWPEVCFWQKFISYFGGMNKKRGGRGEGGVSSVPFGMLTYCLHFPQLQEADCAGSGVLKSRREERLAGHIRMLKLYQFKGTVA